MNWNGASLGFLRPEEIHSSGRRIPQWVFHHGPSRTEKTPSRKAIAGEMRAFPFLFDQRFGLRLRCS